MGHAGQRDPDGLVASHRPVLLDETRDDLSIVTRVGRPDDLLHGFPEHELLVVVQGPHGYVSSGWSGDVPAVPSWDFITAHLSGRPEVLSAEEDLAVLERLVAQFEQRQDAPRLMRGTPEDAALAERIAAGTVGVRLTPTKVVAKRELSQNEPPEVVATIRRHPGGDGPFANAALEHETARLHDRGPAASVVLPDRLARRRPIGPQAPSAGARTRRGPWCPAEHAQIQSPSRTSTSSATIAHCGQPV